MKVVSGQSHKEFVCFAHTFKGISHGVICILYMCQSLDLMCNHIPSLFRLSDLKKNKKIVHFLVLMGISPMGNVGAIVTVLNPDELKCMLDLFMFP